jgi:hypothetical protein
MAARVRKTICKEPAQALLLKQTAAAEGVSEDEIVRRAINLLAEQVSDAPRRQEAWHQARQVLDEWIAHRPLPKDETAPWRREDLYDRQICRGSRRNSQQEEGSD